MSSAEGKEWIRDGVRALAGEGSLDVLDIGPGGRHLRQIAGRAGDQPGSSGWRSTRRT